MQQMQAVCAECAGEGKLISGADQCPTCRGKKTVSESKILEVHVDKGMRDGEKVVFRGEGDQHPNVEAGDVIIVLSQKPHDRFDRKGSDLVMVREITLTEALCGVTLVVKHLDGRQLVIRTIPGEVIKPGDIKGVPSEGMPMHRNPFEKGFLYIKFDVKFPDKQFTSADNFARLESLLPPREPAPVVDLNDEMTEEVTLMDYEPSTRGSGMNGASREAYEEDDDDERHGPGVQCASH